MKDTIKSILDIEERTKTVMEETDEKFHEGRSTKETLRNGKQGHKRGKR